MRMYKMTTKEKRYNFDNPADMVKFFTDAGLVKSATVTYSDDEAGLLDHVYVVIEIDDYKRDYAEGYTTCTWMEAAYGLIKTTKNGKYIDKRVMFTTRFDSTPQSCAFDSSDHAGPGAIDIRNPIEVLRWLDDLCNHCDVMTSRHLDKLVVTLIPDIKRLDSEGHYNISYLDIDTDDTTY
jgi:hypothetical protein